MGFKLRGLLRIFVAMWFSTFRTRRVFEKGRTGHVVFQFAPMPVDLKTANKNNRQKT